MGVEVLRWVLATWLVMQASTAWDFPPNAQDVVIREPGRPGLGWSWGEGAPRGRCAQTGALYSDLTGDKGRTLWVCERGTWASK